MVNEQGYYRPTYDELLAGRIAQAQELFGEDIDTSNASPLGKFIRLSVQDLADAYEAQEIIYYSRFPHTATGQNLDRLMPFAGITRNPATRANTPSNSQERQTMWFLLAFWWEPRGTRNSIL